MAQESMELSLSVLVDGASEDELDLTTRDLQLELLEGGLARVELTPAISPRGAKGTGTIVGDLTVAVIAPLVVRLCEVLWEWRKRGKGRSFEIRTVVDGQPIRILLDGIQHLHASEAAQLLLRRIGAAGSPAASAPPVRR
jgi:hypothetical protein